MQAAERNLQRLPGQDQRQQREDMRQALVRPVPHEVVDERHRFSRTERVEQPPAFPDRPADGHFPQHECEDPFLVDSDGEILLDNGRKRSRALKAHLESQIVEPEHQTVGRALRHADREHARQPPPDREILVRIEQRIDQFADMFLGDLAQRKHRRLGDRVPGEQRHHVRHEQS